MGLRIVLLKFGMGWHGCINWQFYYWTFFNRIIVAFVVILVIIGV